MGEWLLSRRDRLIVARHEVLGSDAESPVPERRLKSFSAYGVNPGLSYLGPSGRMTGAKQILTGEIRNLATQPGERAVGGRKIKDYCAEGIQSDLR
jgi:hypothetical protein